MKLFHSSASPFVRKVLVVADEVGLEGRIELVPAVLSPTSPDAALSAKNPLGKIPALVTDGGEALYDSHVICDYLDGLHAGRKLIPAGPERYEVLRREALADGILEAGILARYENVLRPEALRWKDWTDGQLKKVAQGLAVLEAEVDTWPSDLDLGQITAVCAVGWLEFRKPGGDGLMRPFPKLMRAFERLSQRPSFARTVPHA